jgi:hypothetical protein
VSNSIRIAGLVVCALACAARVEASPILLGQTVQITYQFPAMGSVIQTNTVVVGAGVEWPGFLGIVDVDLADTSITLGNFTSSNAWAAAGFSGFSFFDLMGTIPDFVNVTLAATNMAGFTQANITFDADNIWLNWQGLSYTPSTFLRITIEAATPPAPEPVPEPASVALVAVGLAMAAAAAGRRA